MWTTENRGRCDRSKLRYPSDLTDDEWSLVKPLIPRAKRGGNRRTVDVREVVNGIMYILSTGCQWAALPKDLPPRSTVNSYFPRGEHDRTLDRLHHALYVQCREQVGREASPMVAIIDSHRQPKRQERRYSVPMSGIADAVAGFSSFAATARPFGCSRLSRVPSQRAPAAFGPAIGRGRAASP